jgi:MFS family permease
MLFTPTFRRFWAAQSLAYLGDMVSFIVLPLVAVTTLRASTAQVGLLAALGPLPVLLLAAHVGAWIDRRGGEITAMRIAGLFRAAVLASVPAAAAVHALTFAHLCIAALLVGCASAFFNVAASTALPGLCAKSDLVTANSATRMSFSVAAVAGPSLGGLLVQAVGASTALLLDSAASLFAALLLTGVTLKNHQPKPLDPGSVRDGLRYIRREPLQTGLLVETVTAALAYTAYFTLLLVFATRDLHLSPGQLGTALGIGALGAVIGSALAAPVGRRLGLGRTLVAGAIIYSGILLVVPFAPRQSPAVAMVLITAAELVSAAALMLSEIPIASLQQAITPHGRLGRVRGVTLAANYGARTVAGLLAGTLGTILRPAGAMTLVLGIGVAGGLSLIFTPLVKIKTL